MTVPRLTLQIGPSNRPVKSAGESDGETEVEGSRGSALGVERAQPVRMRLCSSVWALHASTSRTTVLQLEQSRAVLSSMKAQVMVLVRLLLEEALYYNQRYNTYH